MEQPVMFRGLTCVDHEDAEAFSEIYGFLYWTIYDWSFEGIIAEAQFQFCRAWSRRRRSEKELQPRLKSVSSLVFLLLELLKSDTPAESFAHRPAHLVSGPNRSSLFVSVPSPNLPPPDSGCSFLGFRLYKGQKRKEGVTGGEARSVR